MADQNWITILLGRPSSAIVCILLDSNLCRFGRDQIGQRWGLDIDPTKSLAHGNAFARMVCILEETLLESTRVALSHHVVAR